MKPVAYFAIVFLLGSICVAQADDHPASPDNSCEVFAHPERFLGHSVTIHANVGRPLFVAAPESCPQGGRIRFKLKPEAAELTDAARELGAYIKDECWICDVGEGRCVRCEGYEDAPPTNYEIDSLTAKGKILLDVPSWLFEIEEVLNVHKPHLNGFPSTSVFLPLVSPSRLQHLAPIPTVAPPR